jgi:hypothetical protein
MNSNNLSYLKAGCANGYTYDQCNLSCIPTVSTSAVVTSSSVSVSNSVLLISSNLKSGQLIKNKLYAEVFSVDDNLCLHWIINEKTAIKYFGKSWNKNIKDYDQISGYKFCDNLK